MKTAILTATLMILMTAATARTINDTVNTPVFAEQAFWARVVQPESDMIKFSVRNPDADKVVLKIYNDEMIKIFHRTLKSEKSVNIQCDLSNCEAGTYTCVVKRNGLEEVRKEFTLK